MTDDGTDGQTEDSDGTDGRTEDVYDRTDGEHTYCDHSPRHAKAINKNMCATSAIVVPLQIRIFSKVALAHISTQSC